MLDGELGVPKGLQRHEVAGKRTVHDAVRGPILSTYEPQYPAADPNKPQNPPGTKEWQSAGSPKRAQDMSPIPTNSILSPSEGGPPATKNINTEVTAPKADWQAKNLGGGNYRMEEPGGAVGRTYKTDVPPGPADMSNPAWKAEADKESAMYNEPGEVQSAAKSAALSGSQTFKNPLEKSNSFAGGVLPR